MSVKIDEQHTFTKDGKKIKRQDCQIFSRCCGWYVPRHRMNPGKLSERADIKEYNLEVSMAHKTIK